MKISQQPQIIPTKLGIFPFEQKNLPKYLFKIKRQDEIKIVYFGTPEFSAYILDRLIQFCQTSTSRLGSVTKQNTPRSYIKMFMVQAVVSSPDKAAGRKQIVTPSSVSMVAQKYNIPTLKPVKLNDDFVKNHMSFLESDLFIVVSYGQILPQALLDIPRLGAINIHGSLLPKYRGASPIQQAILNGDKQTGITIIKMDEKLDHGPILATSKISILEQDTFESLSKKLMHEGSELLIETLPKFINGKITPLGQNSTMVSFCPKLTRDSGYFDINNPPSPEKLDRMIRAYFPWPGVWTLWSGKIVKFLPSSSHSALDAGSIKIDSGLRQNDDRILLQMEGKKAIPVKDFLNGYPDFPLKSFG